MVHETGDGAVSLRIQVKLLRPWVVHASGPFSGIVDLSLARRLLSWASRDPSVEEFEFCNTDRDMITCVIAGGVLLINSSQDWPKRYARIMRPIRWHGQVDGTSSYEGALVHGYLWSWRWLRVW